MAVTHVMLDLENLKPPAGEVALLKAGDYRLWVFRGPQDTRYDAQPRHDVLLQLTRAGTASARSRSAAASRRASCTRSGLTSSRLTPSKFRKLIRVADHEDLRFGQDVDEERFLLRLSRELFQN